MAAEDRLDFFGRRRSDRHLSHGALRDEHRLANDAKPGALEFARCAFRRGMDRVWTAQHRRTRHRCEDVARIVVAVILASQGVQHLGTIADGSAVDSGAVAIDVGSDRTAPKCDHGLMRQNQRDRIMVRRTTA